MAVAVPPGIAFVRLALATPDAAAFSASIAALPPADPLRRLAEAHPEAWATVRATLSAVDHATASADAASHVRRVAAEFDRAAGLSPEASVALYTLGDPALLEAATEEIVRWLDSRALLRPAPRALDIGCGIGRLERALAPRVAAIVGIDVSPVMVAEAQVRCRDLANVAIRQTSGLDLALFGHGEFDLVLALDSFPYIVAAGRDTARGLVDEAARVLVPGGHLAIFNYAYGQGPAEEAAELELLAGPSGFTPIEMASSPFELWDGRAFLLRRD
jgi:SAM-dependent methyltransferase